MFLFGCDPSTVLCRGGKGIIQTSESGKNMVSINLLVCIDPEVSISINDFNMIHIDIFLKKMLVQVISVPNLYDICM